jgi:hypothetical protein
MKNLEPNDPLRDTLREWQVSATLPPRFQERVWQRIAGGEASERPGFWRLLQNWLVTRVPRSAAAAGYVAVLLAMGVAGHWQGHQKKERVDSQLSQRYVQSVDPYQMPRH